jgi:hypothetical protein
LRKSVFGFDIDKMEVISKGLPQAQALALETDLIQAALAEGKFLYNQAIDTLAEFAGRRTPLPDIEVPKTTKTVTVPKPRPR